MSTTDNSPLTHLLKNMDRNIVIGITDCSKYANYQRWIENEAGTSVIKLSHHTNNINDIEKCDGIVLSGGEDVHPRFYKKEEYLEYCHEIDEKRDDFEWRVLEYVERHQMPLLGICRGLQMANVYFGGTLIPDIPSFGKFNHSKFVDTDRYHVVQVDPNSQLQKIVQSSQGEINSAHHQSADIIGKGLVTNAISPDGVIEGLERKNKETNAYLMLVQWHPERMNDHESIFSKRIKQDFLNAVRKGYKDIRI